MVDELEDGWTSHTAPTGHTYYYNRTTKQSTYKKPVKLSVQTPPTIPQNSLSARVADPQEEVQQRLIATSSASGVKETTSLVAHGQGETNKTQDGDYPKYRFEINTAEPWLLIETKKGREFYYNPDTNESHWQVPEWLSLPLQEWRKSLEEHEVDGASSEVGDESFEDNEHDNFEAEAPAPIDTEYNEDDIAWQLAAMDEEGQGQFNEPEDDSPDFSPTEKTEIFQKMLLDLEIDPFSTWDAELPRIAADPRYLILENTHLRKSAFERYCTEHGLKLQQEKATMEKEDLVKDATRKLAYFQDFKRKHKKDEAYKKFGNSDHDREKLFRAFMDNKKLTQEQRERNFRDLLASSSADFRTDVRFHVLDQSSVDRILRQHERREVI